MNALQLIYAAQQGVIPRITHRSDDAERRSMIESGAVFIFSGEVIGIKRWTDGLLWSSPVIIGDFLVYRERASDRESHEKPNTENIRNSKLQRRNYQGTPDGFIKKTITVTIEGSDFHLISYYTFEDIRNGRLKQPSFHPDIRRLYMPPPHTFQLMGIPPKAKIGPDRHSRFAAGPEELDTIDCTAGKPTHSSPDSPTSTMQSSVDLQNLLNLRSASTNTAYSRTSRWDERAVPTQTARIETLGLRSQYMRPPLPSDLHTHLGGLQKQSIESSQRTSSGRSVQNALWQFTSEWRSIEKVSW
ncbi:hypothetical protein GYMLUDRAFT_242725 [Collybiopsis luxurians FD-317 M1]|uniref:Gti1/Pac2 family-domain-containing protein n=1 Tax=Collybiopsis luxurians FD-317 M1 TaxID=944289 RepID=A0A0D0D0P3_9AGAR|nr:hypothetical protein GYMLUDRAFT_242725 [Collybiopsis luxurians FD-317 M1]